MLPIETLRHLKSEWYTSFSILFPELMFLLTAKPWENNGSCTWMMQFPYFSHDKGGWALESLLKDPQDVLRKNSALSCTLAFRASEVHGREVRTTPPLFLVSSSVSLESGVASSSQDVVTFLCFFISWDLIVYAFTTGMDGDYSRWENESTKYRKCSRNEICLEIFGPSC